MAEGVPEYLPLPRNRRINQDHAGDDRHHVFEENAKPSGSLHPAENAVEYQQADNAKPEDRHGIANKPDNAHQLIRPAILPNGARNAHRHAKRHTDDGGEGGEFQCRWKNTLDILDHRAIGHQRLAEIARSHFLHIDPELPPKRLVEPKLSFHRFIDIARRLVANHGEYRINRHHAPDEESDRKQSKQRQRNLKQEA